jgi:hypothetical protein
LTFSKENVNEVVEASPPVALPTAQPDVRKAKKKKRERGLLARIFGSRFDR